MENPVYPSVLGLIRYDAGCATPKEKYEQKKSECFLNNPELFPNENYVQAVQGERLWPKLVIEKFDGDPIKLQSFSSVHI